MSDGTKSPEAIERDLNSTRARLDSDLTELTNRLSPGQLLDEALHYLRENQGLDFAHRLTESVRERPIPVALAGIGIAWLMIAGPRPPERVIYRERTVDTGLGVGGDGGAEPENTAWSRAWQAGKDVARNASESEAEYRDRVAEARGKVLGVVRQAQETAESFAERVQDALSQAGARVQQSVRGASDQAGSYMRSWRDTASGATQRLGDAASTTYARSRDTLSRGSDLVDTISSNPILLGSVGLLTGALLGALFPASDVERNYLGGMAGQARETARRASQAALDRGQDAAQSVAQAGAEGVRKAADAGREAVGAMAQALRHQVRAPASTPRQCATERDQSPFTSPE